METKEIKFNIEEIEKIIREIKRVNFDYWDFKNRKESCNFNVDKIIRIEEKLNNIKKEIYKK